MKSSTEIGMNRTGMGLSPLHAKELVQGALDAAPIPAGDAKAIDAVRDAYEKEAQPIGSVPPPTTLKGAATTVKQALKGDRPSTLLDKLGERLAFERTGSRLYEALIQKRRADSNGTVEPALADLERFHQQEMAHFDLVKRAIEELGGDPTVETPSADLVGVMSGGVGKVLTDPRTTFTQCLEAILVAELVDNDGWSLLVQLAEGVGMQELADRFQRALDQEDTHLEHVRRWLSERLMKEAKGKG